MSLNKKNITVVGAGLVGSLLSIFLANRGYNINVYERRKDKRKNIDFSSRSINLALSHRGWKALNKVGLENKVKQISIPMYRRVMHSIDRKLTFQPYGKKNQAIFSVPRGKLNTLLVNTAEKLELVNFYFNKKCIDIDLEKSISKFEDTLTESIISVSSDHIIGADGFYSKVRSVMQKTHRFNYQQKFIDHGYKEIEIPPNADGTHKLELNALHIWPRGNFMLIALPNLDGSFTCTLFFPYEGEISFSSLETNDQIFNFFKKTFPDVLDLVPDLIDQYKTNPTSPLGIIRCYPWVINDKVLLIGDSSHATVPFYGQGMNSGFEDCYIFDQLIDKYQNNWTNLFDKYQNERKKNGDAIQDLSMYNFIEMRDRTGDGNFLLQKRIEKKFSEKYPNKWLPLYSMVTFSDISYSEALKIGKKQENIMKKILVTPNIEKRWDSIEIENKILDLL
tara:strand:- start:461 stop:1807 length:1347 start_codon:yes stop_codon:yes gene_type:complete